MSDSGFLSSASELRLNNRESAPIYEPPTGEISPAAKTIDNALRDFLTFLASLDSERPAPA